MHRNMETNDHPKIPKSWISWNCIFCFAIFSILIANSSDTSVSIKYRIDYKRSYLVFLGDTINLTCPYKTPFYKWTPATQPSWILSEDQVYSLKAENLAVSGRYICSAVNGFGHNSAEFNIRVIDKLSNSHEQSCLHLPNGHMSELGPCFANTYKEAELSVTKVWGDDLSLDCECVALPNLADRITYTWEFNPHSKSGTEDEETSSEEKDTPHDGMVQNGIRAPFLEKEKPSLISFVNAYTDPILNLRKITLEHGGEYRCVVNVETTRRADQPNSDFQTKVKTQKLTRSYRVRVQPRTEGDIIQGQHNISATVEVGEDATFTCEISKEEHRSATIRWGKYLSMEEMDVSDFHKNEVLHWAGGKYVVFPTVLPQDLLKFIDISKPLAFSSPGSRRSRLVLRVASPRDAGLYVCSVITESGRDDHKFVYISVKGDTSDVKSQTNGMNSAPRSLTIYIVVPMSVFLICFCAVVSIMIRNRTRKNPIQTIGSRSQKFLIGQEKFVNNSSPRYLDHSSIAGSASMAFSRNASSRLQSTPSISDRLVNGSILKPSPASKNFKQANQAPNMQQPNNMYSMQFMYPSPATECAYISPDVTAPCPVPFAPVQYPQQRMPPANHTTIRTTGFDNQHFLPTAQLPSVICSTPLSFNQIARRDDTSNFQQLYSHGSADSNDCVNFYNDHSSCALTNTCNTLSSQELDSRTLCVSPSSVPESVNKIYIGQNSKLN